ncbi:MAG TPA: hypothetical protein VFF03_18830 [Rhodocyclaceae bacterium]|nr:hypothetical protein [Rhodocyclaceae bacterium]
MNHKQAPWQRTFESFAGPGIHNPSDMMKVSDSDARQILPELAAVKWQPPAYVGEGRHAGYSVCNAVDAWATVLFHAGRVAGFYVGSSLWIAKPHRGKGLNVPLILVAARHRGGTVLPPGVVFQGYTAAGIAAHRSAHRHAVAVALAEGLPVPAEVLREIQPVVETVLAAAA